jgi:hypothetical protein
MQMQLARQILKAHGAKRSQIKGKNIVFEAWEYDPSNAQPLNELDDRNVALLRLSAPATAASHEHADLAMLDAALVEAGYESAGILGGAYLKDFEVRLGLSEDVVQTPQKATDEFIDAIVGIREEHVAEEHLNAGRVVLVKIVHDTPGDPYRVFIENELQRNTRYVAAFLHEHYDRVTREWGDHKVFSYTQAVGTGVGRLSGNDVEAALDELVQQGVLRAVPRPATVPEDKPNPDVTMYQRIDYKCGCPDDAPYREGAQELDKDLDVQMPTRTGHSIACPQNIAAYQPGEFYGTVNRTVAGDLAATGLVEIGPLQVRAKIGDLASLFRRVEVQDHRV